MGDVDIQVAVSANGIESYDRWLRKEEYYRSCPEASSVHEYLLSTCFEQSYRGPQATNVSRSCTHSLHHLY